MPFENGEIVSKDSSSEIKILSAMEAIKKRPDMYMPNYRQNGVRQMVMAVFDNFFAPFGNRAFEVDIERDRRLIHITIDLTVVPNLKDFAAIHKDSGKSGVRVMLEELHACNCQQKLFHNSTDIGLVVVNAFCKNLWWYDHHSELHYQNGIFKSENFSCKFMSFGFIQMTLEPIDEISFEGP